ncbi:MAG TPA: thiamine pyrophosphate-binding protein [Chloroflexi bacterium]|nr:thiamine pyrophosphate-binding protein [Chloroflexota bacterium]
MTQGKHLFMQSLIARNVRYIFGNPGTTETPLLDCLADYPQIEYILTLHEGVAVGMADAYALAAGQPAVLNLHVAPGLGNGLGMLYNAFTGRSPVIITAGEPDTRLRLRDPLLSHDLVAMSAPFTKWSVRAERADELPLILHRAFKIAQDPPSGPVFIALPVNVMEEQADARPFPPARPFTGARPDPDALQEAASILLRARRPVIVCGAGVSRAHAQAELVSLAERLSAPVWNTLLTSAVNFPMHHPLFRGELTDNQAHIRHCLGEPDVVLLVGGHFFSEVFYTPTPSWPAEAAVIQIEAAPEALARNVPVTVGLVADPRESLQELDTLVAAGATAEFQAASAARREEYVNLRLQERQEWKRSLREGWDLRPMTIARLMTELGPALPPNVVVVSEVNTGRRDLIRAIPFERPGDYYGSRGGGIGQGLPGALGCRLAHPDRPLLALSSDGSALYSIQALWTAAHYHLPITFVILNNRAYQIVKQNLDRYRDFFGVSGSGYPHLDLTEPDIDYVQLAQGFGVPARRVEDPTEIGPAVRAAFETEEPYLLDVLVSAGP